MSGNAIRRVDGRTGGRITEQWRKFADIDQNANGQIVVFWGDDVQPLPDTPCDQGPVTLCTITTPVVRVYETVEA